MRLLLLSGRATITRWLSAFLLLLLGAAPAWAQVDTYQFAASSSTFTPITTGTSVSILGDDLLASSLPLGFTFRLDGVSYTTVTASSNGYLSFGASPSTSSYNNSLSTTAAAGDKPLLAAYWDDLTGGSSGSPVASYLTTGTAPNRVFTFQWLNWTTLGEPGPTLSFQIKLYETTNVIQFIYRPEANTLTTASASIGLAGPVVGSAAPDFLSVSTPSATATVSSTVENNSISSVPPSGQVYSFTPAPPAACATPRNLSATVTPTTAVLRWTVNGGTGPFTVQYGLPGFDPTQPSTGANSYTTLTNVTGTSTPAITGLVPATTYQFYVTQNCGGTAGNSNRSNAGGFTTQITNDDPCGATLLPVNNTCTLVNGTTTGATTTNASGVSNPGACSGFNLTPFDVWFQFTTAATGPTSTGVRITVTGSTANVVQAFSAATCTGPFTSRGCVGSSSTAAAPNLDLTGLAPSTTYYVRVFNYDDFQPALGPFTICAVPVPNCPAPTGVAVSSVTNTTAAVSWVAGSGGGTYKVVYGPGTFTPPTGGTTVSGLTTTSTNLTGLTPNTTYSLYVQQVCGGFNGASLYAGPITFTTPLTAPLNDEPCGAFALTTASQAGTNLGATTTVSPVSIVLPLPTCSGASAPKDVWYTFIPTGTSTTLTFSGVAAGAARLFTLNGSCSAGTYTQVACQAATSPTASLGTFTFPGLAAGTRYYLAVSGYASNTATGSFTILGTALGARAQAETNALVVFPNPSNTGQLNLRLNTATAGSATLLNALGQVVLTKNLTAGSAEHSLTTQGLATGVYTLRVQQGEEVMTRKVVLD